MLKLYHNFACGGLYFLRGYASVRRMKKNYNLFSWVVIINLIVMMVPWRVMAIEDSLPSVESNVGIVEDSSGSEVDDVEDDDSDTDNDVDDNNLEDDLEIKDKLPILYIRAINPGYKIDGVNNVGEMIEIGKNSDDLVLLAGVTVSYTNSSGKETVLVEFPENSYLAGESLLLRLGSSPMSELSNITYSTTLALKAGPLALSLDGEVIDSVCWNGKEGCEKEFTSSDLTTLVRNLETGEFEHLLEYEPKYSAENYIVTKPSDETLTEEDEIAENEEEDEDECKDEDDSVIDVENEIHDQEPEIDDEEEGMGKADAEEVSEKVCEEGKYLNPLTGRCKKIEVETVKTCTEGYYLNEATGRCRKVVVEEEKICDEGYYLNEETGRCRKIVVEEEKTCSEGYYLNEATGRCRKIIVEEEKVCADGYYLNEATGRCRKIVVEEEKICADGQYLNPLTGRCKKIEVETIKTCAEGYYLNEETGRCRKIVIEEEKTCDEGYYLNEATGRCKKIVENNGADYSLEKETYEENSSFIALYVVLGVIGVGLVYVVYEFRKEIGRFLKRLFRKK